MNWGFEKITGLFSIENSQLLLDGLYGVEREAQRTAPSGDLATTTHPAAFGNKLENTLITTDFSESQIELVTPPFETVEKTYAFLKELHLLVDKELGSEYLWPLSMPPRLPEEKRIPIAKFDDSPEGREKELYRNGLATRYGRKMQMISGIHYNFSFGDSLVDYLYQSLGNGMDKRAFADDMYFSMARNFLRYRWLLIYLFGASPCADQTYYPVIGNEMKMVRKCCPECCSPRNNDKQNAVSLRVSRFGYSDSVQGKYSVSYNSLKEYTAGIRRLLATKSRKFTRLGLYQNGRQTQMNGNILQKESEFYSSIRLKQNLKKGETQLDALENRGVKYAEVRIIDLNPFDKTGISLEQLRFLQVFMLFCLFEESPPIEGQELEKINKNHHLVALLGRKNKLKLFGYGSGQAGLTEWSRDIFNKLSFIASLIDSLNIDNRYQKCVRKEYEKTTDLSLLPSSMIEREISRYGEGYLEFGIRKAIEHRKPENAVTHFYYAVCPNELNNKARGLLK
jgi:glutamate--cysteine ligase